MSEEGEDNIPLCPVLYPNEHEFQDFSKYLEQMVAKMGTTPIFKVS